MLRLFFALVLAASVVCLSLSGMGARANERQKSLQEIQSQIKSKQEQKDSLTRELKAAEKELEDVRNKLVNLGEAVGNSEEKLTSLEDRIQQLTQEEQALTSRLSSDYSSISAMILGLQRIRRTPPEALLLKPGKSLENAQAALVLRSTLPAIQKRANSFNANMKKLQDMRTALEQDKAEIRDSSRNLSEKQTELRRLVKERENAQKKISSSLGESDKNLRALSAQARSLQDLMNRLEQEEKRRRQRDDDSNATAAAARSLPAPGSSRLPVAGKIITGYGQKDDIGAISQGYSIEARGGALVTAPQSGIVRFADTFKNYGRMIIIEHNNGYHSLMGGLARIDTRPGQSIKAGEPVGILPATSSRGGLPALYYEVRHKGAPVNPARFLTNLKS